LCFTTGTKEVIGLVKEGAAGNNIMKPFAEADTRVAAAGTASSYVGNKKIGGKAYAKASVLEASTGVGKLASADVKVLSAGQRNILFTILIINYFTLLLPFHEFLWNCRTFIAAP
jgi:ABC-type molybdenum transport system ATPase subunit/photorepair protein PhrA